MQIERLFANSSIAKKRRSSYISVNSVSPGSVETLLSPRTAKFINKSRRSSLVAEVLGGSGSSSSTGSGSAGAGGSGISIETRRRSIINTFCDKSTSNNDYAFPATEAMDYTMMEDEEATNPLDHDYDHLRQQQYDHNFSSFSPPIAATSTQTSSSRPRSNSISSSISESLKKLTQYNNLPNFDIHTMYKIKKRRSSSGNVDQQHQNQAQTQKDVCVRDIKNDGIGAMLNSRVPLCYFLHHLLEEYSCENLFFYLELQQYERINYVSVAQQLAAAEHIHDTYLARNCQFEVNLDDKVRSSVTSALEARNADHCFQTAKREVYLLLESSFMQFMRTDIWNQMIENCGEVTEYYDNEKRDKAVNSLIGYLEKMQSLIYSGNHTATPTFMDVNQSTRQHHDMVKAMVHEFCRTLIGIEFEYYRSASAGEQPSSLSMPTSPTSSSPQNQQPSRRGLKQKHVVLFDFFGKKRLH